MYVQKSLNLIVAVALCAVAYAAPEKPRRIRTATANGITWSFAVEHSGAIITSGQKEKPAIDAGTEGDIVIPPMLGGFPVREIGDYAFYGCGAVSSIKIPADVSRVGEFAFYDCLSIRDLNFPEGVLTIGKGACHGMKALESVKIFGNVEIIEDKLFEQCDNLREIDLGKGVKRVSGKSFEHCRVLGKLVFPETLESIDNRGYAYGVCDSCNSLQEVVFLGPPPTIKNFGINLDGKVYYTKKYRIEWERWLKSNAIEGEEISGSDLPNAKGSDAKPSGNGALSSHSDMGEPNPSPPQGGDTGTPTTDSHIIALDVSPSREAFNTSGISHYRCRSALEEFETAITDANAKAATNRVRVTEMVVKYLKTNMEKAQSVGDLDKLIAFRKALETAEGEIEGQMEEIVKLRARRDVQWTRIDKALVTNGATAAKRFYGTLEWEKKEMTKKGDIDEAQNVAAFQKKVEAWMNAIQEQATPSVTR